MDEKLKERLFGAVILVALAIVFVPMLFDKSLPPGMDPSQSIQASPHWSLNDVQITRPDSTAPDQRTLAQTPASQIAIAPSFEAKAWCVQLGTFSDQKNAQQLQKKLLESGYSAYSIQVGVGGRMATQVMVGPELEKEAASRLRDALRAQFALKGTIVDYNPAAG